MHKLWLVRHGESLANAGFPTLDSASPGLTDLGREQAEKFAALVSQRPDRVLTSKYIRTSETAAPLLKRFQMEPEVEEIHEWDFLSTSRYANTTHAERQTAVAVFRATADPNTVDGEGAESYTSLEERVARFLIRAEALSGFTLAYTHGRFMRAVVHVLTGLNRRGVVETPPTRMRSFWLMDDVLCVPNTRVIQLEYSEGRWLMDPFTSPV